MMKNERPWKEQQRSWILFKDDIKKNSDIISGEIEGNSYFLDCESGRLSIWSEKWETFTDVGVSRLIRQERTSMEGHVIPREKGVHIFYKGIELQKKYEEKDTELIEFIDIKKELKGNLINLSRGGFTSEGERFFETELYPGLLDAIQTVLRHIEQQEGTTPDQKDSSKLNELIIKNITKKRDRITEKLEQGRDDENVIEDENNLIALVVSSVVLAYLAIRDQWSIYSSKMSDYHAPRGNGWFKLLDEIDKTLQQEEYKKMLEELAESTSFFGLDGYDENGEDYYKRGQRRDEKKKPFYFLNIFQKDKHYAILQVRENQASSWISYLIYFTQNKEQKDKEKISGEEIYRRILEIPHKEEADLQLERWSKDLFENGRAIPTNVTGGQQFVLNWILKNVPTVALFSDSSGNSRLNVLSSSINPSIYMNKNFKYLIINRILEKARKENIKRFSTMTWQGMEYLSCPNLSNHTLFVKRGYLSEYSYRETPFPYDKTLLEQWNRIIESGRLKKEIGFKIDRLFSEMDIKNSLTESLQKQENLREDTEIAPFLRNKNAAIDAIILGLFDQIFAVTEQENYYPSVSFMDLLSENEVRFENWKWIYDQSAEIYLNDPDLKKTAKNIEAEGKDGHINSDESKAIESIFQNVEFPSLCAAWYYCYHYQETLITEVHLNEIIDSGIVEALCKNELKIISYIKEHGYFPVSEEDIRERFLKYKQEIFEMIQQLEMREIQKRIHDFLSKYRFVFHN